MVGVRWGWEVPAPAESPPATWIHPRPACPPAAPLPAGCATAGKAGLVMNFVLLVSLLVGGFPVK